jgi:quinol monooxygenase YgiN
MTVVSIFEVRFKPDAAEAGVARLEAALAETRAFAGNLSVRMLVGSDDPARVVLVEEWERREDQEAYVAWRRQGNSAFDPEALAGPPSDEFFDER